MSEAAADRIRVAVVDDHEMFRAGVIATLRDSFDIVGQAADVPGSVAMIAQTKPQVYCWTCTCRAAKVAAVPRSLPSHAPTPPLLCFLRCRFRMRLRMWVR